MTLQRYRSHKEVFAGKIQGIRKTTGEPYDVVSYVVVGGKQYVVPENFAARGCPEIGDYLVRYEDGYLSWSPAKAFEDGNTLVEDAAGAVAHKEGDVTLHIEPAKMGAKPSL